MESRAGSFHEFIQRGQDVGAVFRMDQLEAGGANHFLLFVTQNTVKGWVGIADAAIGIADGENVIAILDDQAGHNITQGKFSFRHGFLFRSELAGLSFESFQNVAAADADQAQRAGSLAVRAYSRTWPTVPVR